VHLPADAVTDVLTHHAQPVVCCLGLDGCSDVAEPIACLGLLDALIAPASIEMMSPSASV
jgi:hypothetical protein